MKRALLLLFVSATLYAADPAPEGDFRGLSWGADINSIDGMVEVRTDPSYGGIIVYQREGDKMQIGAAELSAVEYHFWRGKLCSCIVKTEGSTNWYGLKEAVFKKYGKGIKSNPYIESYNWWNKRGMTVSLEYSEITQKGALWLSSKALGKEMEKYEKEMAESAKDDF